MRNFLSNDPRNILMLPVILGTGVIILSLIYNTYLYISGKNKNIDRIHDHLYALCGMFTYIILAGLNAKYYDHNRTLWIIPIPCLFICIGMIILTSCDKQRRENLYTLGKLFSLIIVTWILGCILILCLASL